MKCGFRYGFDSVHLAAYINGFLKNSENDLQIIKLGSSDGSSVTNTNVRATVTGTILEIPIKKGDQVIQANTFNPGTTIATIADLNVMIFEGKVDEGEVSKLKKEMDLKVNLAAIENKTYPAKLKFIAPKGVEEAGAVQFKIEGEVFLDDEYICLLYTSPSPRDS